MKFIRPEDIKIYDKDGPERVKGKIRKLIFKGGIVEYYVLVEDEELIGIELSKDSTYNKGDIVYLEFNYGEIENPM